MRPLKKKEKVFEQLEYRIIIMNVLSKVSYGKMKPSEIGELVAKEIIRVRKELL